MTKLLYFLVKTDQVTADVEAAIYLVDGYSRSDLDTGWTIIRCATQKQKSDIQEIYRCSLTSLQLHG